MKFYDIQNIINIKTKLSMISSFVVSQKPNLSIRHLPNGERKEERGGGGGGERRKGKKA